MKENSIKAVNKRIIILKGLALNMHVERKRKNIIWKYDMVR